MTKLSEWSFKSFNSIQMGKFGDVWMVNMTDKLMEAGVGNDFTSKFNEARCGYFGTMMF